MSPRGEFSSQMYKFVFWENFIQSDTRDCHSPVGRLRRRVTSVLSGRVSPSLPQPSLFSRCGIYHLSAPRRVVATHAPSLCQDVLGRSGGARWELYWE